MGSYTSFISEELLRRATRDSTLVESGRKQGWSGLRIFPSSGMQVSIQVSKKGTSPEGLESDRITWKGTSTGSASHRDPAGDPHPEVCPPPWGACGCGNSAALWPGGRDRHWSGPSRALVSPSEVLVSRLWAVVSPKTTGKPQQNTAWLRGEMPGQL